MFTMKKPEGLELTEEQREIRDVIKDGNENVMVFALAGTGKTTQMVLGLKALQNRVLAGRMNAGVMAFNKSIGDELRRKVPGGVFAGTSHSLCYKIIRDNWGKVDVDPDKTWNIINELKEDHGIRYWRRGQRPAIRQLVSLLKQEGYDPRKPDEVVVDEVCTRHGIYWPGEDNGTLVDYAHDVLRVCLKRARETIDFDDQIWIPYVEQLTMKPFDLLMVDEGQDLNRVQQYVALENAKRLVVVGDVHQCQPAETQVSLTGGGKKSIRDVKVGDELVSYSRDSGCFTGRIRQGRKVLGKSVSSFSGEMVTVQAGDKQTSCTPNHKWIVRFTERSENLFVVYLMKKGSKYRVGWCQLFDVRGNLHLGTRCRLEKADFAWILSVHENRTEASMEESFVATYYGLPLPCRLDLPLITFREIPGSKHFTQEAIDAFFLRFNDPDIWARAQACLADHHRRVEYPFYRAGKRRGRTTLFEIEACNLISGVMSVPLYEGNRKVVWEPIRISRQERDCPVYSLEVESNHTYIADGLATHNSLYGFRGADPRSMDTFRDILEKRGGVREMPLTICWRCPESVIEMARMIVPEINARPGADRGEVVFPETEEAYQDWNSGDMVLCRTNAPLIGNVYRLWRDKRRAYIQGRDVGAGLKRMLERFEDEADELSLPRLSRWIDFFEVKQREKLEERRGSLSSIAALEDKCECLRVMVDNAPNSGSGKRDIATLWEDMEFLFQKKGKPEHNIRLSSVHRAKGLEADRVYILEPELMPHHMARQEWEQEQERNIAYVAVTRAKNMLASVGGMSVYFR